MADDDADTPAAEPTPERRDAAARAGDLARMAEDNAEATFGTTNARRGAVPGLISGDLGPKGIVAAQHRELSRVSRASKDEVPPGTVARDGLRLVLIPMLAIAALLAIIVIVIFWLVA